MRCVIANMCALMLDSEGRAKRIPWQDGPELRAPSNVAQKWDVYDNKEAARPDDGEMGIPSFRMRRS